MKLPPVEDVQELVALVEKNELEELTLEEGDCSVSIRREYGQPVVVTAPAPGEVLQAKPESATPAAAAAEAKRHLVHISSPLVGVFYRAPDPASDPYVEVGSTVEEGTVVGLVEAMKVFNEIVAEVRGRVVEIPAENEQLVSRGETLVLIEPL